MKFTEEKRYWNFSRAVVPCQDETQCVGNVHNVSSSLVAESATSSWRTSIVDVELVKG